jgi:hypothetical protein
MGCLRPSLARTQLIDSRLKILLIIAAPLFLQISIHGLGISRLHGQKKQFHQKTKNKHHDNK